jgi:hypothetical protein
MNHRDTEDTELKIVLCDLCVSVVKTVSLFAATPVPRAIVSFSS